MSWWIWVLIAIAIVLYLGVGLGMSSALNWEGAAIAWHERLCWMILWPFFVAMMFLGR